MMAWTVAGAITSAVGAGKDGAEHSPARGTRTRGAKIAAMPLLLAGAVSGFVSALALGLGALTRGGALAGWVVGAGILAGTGWTGGLVLGMFFLSSTLVSGPGERRFPEWVDAKAGRRDAWQVLANGGPALVGALAAPGTGGGAESAGLWIVAASLAAAAADTWATAAGAFSPADPFHPIRWVRVPKGASGGVSLRGTLGGVAGAALVAATAGIAAGSPPLAGGAWLLGLAGMMVDSVLGATLQGRFRCPRCDQPSERARHRCGTPTWHVGGLAWVQNDAVNLAATGLAALAGAVCWAWLSS